jgi:hypothetical protein
VKVKPKSHGKMGQGTLHKGAAGKPKRTPKMKEMKFGATPKKMGGMRKYAK